ncbi:MAG: CapA family protein [Flavobacteriales bacterium]|nr:CapA family protein [Flavobacteriales bacterium]
MEEPSLAFVGDIMLSRGVGARLAEHPDTSILAPGVTELLARADYRIGNLECPISASGAVLREVLFRADPATLVQLRQFDLLTLANNHTHDCGRQGVDDTVAALEAGGYAHTGLCNANGQQSWFTCTIKGMRIAILAMARPECIPVSESGRRSVNRTDAVGIMDLIAEKRQTHDKLVTIIHGGNEMIPEPSPTLVSLAHDLVDAGTDIVVTHHPHVLGGMESYNDGLIFYSLGDFIFDGQSNLRRRGAVLTITFGQSQTNWEMTHTTIQSDLTVDLANSVSAGKAKKEFERVSREIVSKGYEGRYDRLYRTSMMRFQIDRLFFLLRNRGITFVLSFGLSRMKLIPYYFNSVLNRLHR